MDPKRLWAAIPWSKTAFPILKVTVDALAANRAVSDLMGDQVGVKELHPNTCKDVRFLDI